MIRLIDRWGVFIGLTLIGIGSGGIKPCVSAFGGDQFGPDQVISMCYIHYSYQ